MVPQPAPPFVEPSEAEKIVSSGKSIFLLYICCRSSLFLFRPAADRANWCCIFLRPSPVAVAVCTHLVALFRLLRIRESPLGEISLSHGNASRESDRDATLTYSLTLTHCRLQHCFSSLAALFSVTHSPATRTRFPRLFFDCNAWTINATGDASHAAYFSLAFHFFCSGIGSRKQTRPKNRSELLLAEECDRD